MIGGDGNSCNDDDKNDNKDSGGEKSTRSKAEMQF